VHAAPKHGALVPELQGLELESRGDLRTFARMPTAVPAEKESLHDASSLVVTHVRRDGRELRLLVRVPGGEVGRVARAADAVHLVGIRALRGAHLDPAVDGVLHVCRDSCVSLDEALGLVQLGAFPSLHRYARGASGVVGLGVDAVGVACVRAPRRVAVQGRLVDELGLGLGVARRANHELCRHADDAAVGKLAAAHGHEDLDVVLGAGVVGQVGAHGEPDGGDGEVVADGLEVAAPLAEPLRRGDAVVSAFDAVRVQHGDEGADDAERQLDMRLRASSTMPCE